VVGNTAAFDAGLLLSNGYACFVLASVAHDWEVKYDHRIIRGVRSRVILKPIQIHLTPDQ